MPVVIPCDSVLLVRPTFFRLIPPTIGLLLSTAIAGFGQVPTEIQMPGTQPLEIPPLTPPEQCDNCHAGYDIEVEPAHFWRGSLMAFASHDPIFWASVAIAEQDFAGSGDLCLRCHTADGWLTGHSTPTNGSALTEADGTGVSCHLCHRMADPDGSEHPGVQFPPYLAHDDSSTPEAWLGSGMFTLIYDDVRLGPYDDAASPHNFASSEFHRSPDFCGTCHDVSNPATGDLAPGNGAQRPLAAGSYSGELGTPVAGKAAFNNPPYAYGVVERTFSEHMASGFPGLSVGDYTTLPADLQAGSIELAWMRAMASTLDGDYVDGAPRTFTCQTCHLPPVVGKGAKQHQAPVRDDLPLHDMTGGNYWMPDVLAYFDQHDQFQLGGDLSDDELAGLAAGKQRALDNLQLAAGLRVEGNRVDVINLTGHKLISGYPEGRRMWLRTRWFDGADGLLREDGAYGPLQVSIEGVPTTVETLLEPEGPHTRVYEAHFGISQEWASQLIGYGVSPQLPLQYDRVDGSVTHTLGELAAQAPGSALESFHFVLNNELIADNRIPPYGMAHDLAEDRNILPVPEELYGAPTGSEAYDYWDELTLEPPVGAVRATIELLYQPTSWEYVQFLLLANAGLDSFLADAGQEILDAWMATGMAAPVVMTQAEWFAPAQDCNDNGVPDWQDIANGTSLDCNANGVPDECDLASGTSLDLDGDGILDECEPQPFCSAKLSSLGCVPAIESTGLPTATGPDDFVVTASNVIAQTTGRLLVGTRRNPSAGTGGAVGVFGSSRWGTSVCILQPERLSMVASGGTPGGCDGSFAVPITQAIMNANGWLAGTTVLAQFVYLDANHPDGTDLGHTDALEIVIQP